MPSTLKVSVVMEEKQGQRPFLLKMPNVGRLTPALLGETGKGFANYLMVLGIVETVALFVMVFALQVLGRLG